MTIPLHLARLMSPADRARYFPESVPQEPAVGPEPIEQGKFARWLYAQWEAGALEYFWQRLDKRATGKPGTPDFIIALPRAKTLWIEFKASGGHLSIPQAATFKNLARLGHSPFIAYSSAQAIRIVELELYSAGTVAS
jgi:hypothetical protein